MQKRLKSLDEGKAPQIISDATLNEAIRRKASESKTYAHNKKVMSEVKNQDSKKVIPIRKVETEPSVFEVVLRNLYYIAIVIIAVILLAATSNIH